MRLTNHSLRSRYDRIAGRMNTDAWPGWLVVQSRRNRMWRPGCANPHRPSFGKIWSCRVSRSSPSRFKGLFPRHTDLTSIGRRVRKRRRFQDGDGVDFSTLILRPKLGCCGRSMRYCWRSAGGKTGNRWRVPHPYLPGASGEPRQRKQRRSRVASFRNRIEVVAERGCRPLAIASAIQHCLCKSRSRAAF